MSASSSSYRRVSQRESGNESTPQGSSGTSSNPSTTRTRGERLEDKSVALAWVIWAALLAHWTDFFAVVWSDERLNRTLVKVAGAGFLVAVSLFLYLTLYLPRIKGLSDSSVWGVYCPKVLPAMCATGLASYLVFVRALWPYWGFMSPLISGTEIMGMLMVLHFVPALGLC